MYLTIKRKDSVSSILLFIFNVFLVEQGITSIPLRKIFQIMEPFQKNETAIRMGLSREIQNGLLVNRKEQGEVFYALTNTALEGFKYWMKTMDYDRVKMQLQFEEWKGVWSILVITGPIKIGKEIIDAFYGELRQLSYGILEKNIWISPYPQCNYLPGLIRRCDLTGGIYLFESRLNDFGSVDSLTASVWSIRQLEERYLAFLNLLKEETKTLNMASLEVGGELPSLYRLGLEYFGIIQDDPRLPLKLLPSGWVGIKAAKSFQQLREEILPKANQFISNILD